ncbi:autotransporter-associated beta strand repeat-containing protein [Lysobacter soyae]|uniref:Autotransporter-associated beta strand repeat-containing protein n=1 Tax=Lysobacter soyae TaxID=2764185 RepID=A0ABX8WP01_9GAMM|nr:autotransporter-associated beta strand repeat-containing protein [Lysobacter sp. CJ11]QYR52656.1 autotransporter-associated beta strand repeat-containing protein [Lysobacter sp. CJ11]
MNHIYRLVWNCAKRCLQVVSERSSGGSGGRVARRRANAWHPLSRACALAFGTSLLLVGLPAAAQSVGGRGGAGESGVNGRGGDTTAGGECGYPTNCPTGPGNGANGYGGQGGGNAINTGTGAVGSYFFSNGTVSGAVTGGAGAAGTFATGGGGISAPGVYVGANVSVTVSGTGNVTGGAGGAGTFDGTGGGGGAAGAGIQFVTGGALSNTGVITGGAGGHGADFAYAGGGGGGGSAVSGGALTINNTGTITGGAGGTGGLGAYSGGGGGGGHAITGDNLSISNSGTLQGGAAGAGGTGASAGTAGDALLVTGGNNTLNMQAGSNIVGAIETFAGSSLTVNSNANNQNINGALINNGAVTWNTSTNNNSIKATDGSGTLTKTGTGTLSLLGNSTRTGNTVISAGTLQVGSSTTHGELSGAIDVATGARLVFDNADQFTRTDGISGAGTVVQSGSGTTVFAGNNTYTGLTQINAGTLQVGNGGTTGSLGSGAVSNFGNLIFNRSDVFSVNNQMSGSGAVIKQGAGTMIYLGGGSRTGTTQVQAGTLQLGDGVTPGGGIGDGVVSLNAGAALVYNTATSYQHNAQITGNGSVEKKGPATLLLTGANTFSGGLTLTSGNLGITSGAALGTGTFTHNGGALDNQGASFTLFNDMVLGATGGLFRITSGTLTLAGPVSGAGGLWTTGFGTLALAGPTLTATGSYTFDTPVVLTANTSLASNSIVRFNNTLNGGYALTIDAGDIVSFNGITGGTAPLSALTVTSGGAVALGNMRVAGNVSATAAGNVLSNGAVSLAGNTSLRSNGGNVTFTNAANDFSGTVNVTAAGNAQINDANALTLGSLSTNGNMTATSHGALNAGTGSVGGILTLNSNNGSLTQGGALNVTGNTVLNAGTGNISLTNAGNTFAGSVAMTGNSAALVANSAITLGALNVQNLQVSSPTAIHVFNNIVTPGAQTFNGPVRVNADLAFTSTSSGDLTFNGTLNGANVVSFNSAGTTRFNGAVGGTTALAGLSTDAGGQTLVSGNITTSGAQTYNDAFVLGADATLTSTASGDLNFNNSMSGAHALTTSTNGMTAFNGPVSLSALDVSSGSVTTSDVTVTGPLSIRTTAGSITQTAGVYTVGGTSNFNAGSNAINLSGLNAFTGNVNLTGGTTAITNLGTLNLGTVNAASLTATSIAGSFGMQNANIAGALNASAQGSLGQSGAWVVGGTSTLNAASGDITLSNANNDFVGAVSLTGRSIQVSDVNSLNVTALTNATNAAVSLTAGGALSLPTTNIDTGTSNLSLQSGAGLTTSGNLSGANIDLRAAGQMNLANVTAANGLNVSDSAGNVAATGVVRTGILTGDVSGGAGFNNLSNQISALGNFNAGSLSIATAGNLAINGTVNTTGNFNLGPFTTATLTGALNAAQINLALQTSLNVGNFDATGSLNGNVNITAGSTLAFRRTGTTTLNGVLLGAGNVRNLAGGTLVLNGDNSAFTGSTQVSTGTLIVGDTAGSAAKLGGNVTVTSAGTLGGHGTLTGNVAVTGGHVNPGNSIGTLTVAGDYSSTNGVLDFEVGAPGPNFQTAGTSDRLIVGGNVSFDNTTLNVIDTGAMGPGMYTLVTWGGTLTESNGGLILGTTPSGHTVQLQRLATAKQINLIDSTGVTVQFWNGDGTATLGQLGGGSGTWTSTSTNWSNANGDLSGAMTPQPGFAIFSGTPGTVTVDASAGAVRATGLQFASSGYTLAGDSINLLPTPAGVSTVRVGDGSAAASTMTATIASVIGGATGIDKTDAGRLILTGNNTYTGNTMISGGTLQLGNGGTSGSVAGNITNNGALVMDRSDNIAYAGSITGNGSIKKSNVNTLTLTGNSSAFAGVTTVDLGRLNVGDAAGSAAVLGGDVHVGANAAFGTWGTLGGHGTIGGNVTLDNGAHLAPGTSLGTLTVAGDFTAAQGSVLDFEIGAPGANFQTAGTSDRLNVGGNLNLQGATMNLTDAGGMGPGMYTLLTWGGTLTETNGGLVLGTTPTGQTVSLQRLTASRQINLLDTTGVTVQFWNGDGTATLGQLGGGSGTWTSTSTNWSNANGDLSGAMAPQPGFAIFSGTPGTVTVDASAGAVRATGLQFASSGYTLAGDSVNLLPTPAGVSTVRVGDGTTAASNMTATIASVIGGATGINKTDAGTLVLTANNTFSGNTMISGGTLQLGNGGTTGSVAGNITNNAALVIDRSDNFTLANTMTGAGSFVKRGAGTLTLTGNSAAFAGNTTFLQGNVVLGPTAGSAAVLGGNARVEQGVTLSGHGRIGGALTNFGTVSPGSSPGTLTVGGNYVQSSGGTLVIEALPDGTSDHLVVGGSASLAGRLQVLPQAGTWSASTNYTILTAAGGVSGTFSNVTSSLAFLNPVLAYTTNAVNLTLQRNDVAFTDVAVTPNQVGVANALDGLGIGNPVYTAFTRLNADGAVLALDQLSGEIHPDVRANLIDQSRLWRDGIRNRLSVAHEDVGTHAWVSAFGGGGELEGDANAADSRADAVGAMAGVDFAAGEHARVGVAVATGYTDVRLNARFSHGKVDSTAFGAYAQADLGPVALEGTVWRGNHRIETHRSVEFGGLLEGPMARYDGNTTAVSLKLGHRFEWAGASLMPYLEATHVRVGTDAFAESGGGTALRGSDADDRRTLLTGGVHWSAHVGRGSVVLYGDAGWTQVVGNKRASSDTLQFVSGNVPFNVVGVEGAQNVFHIDSGIQWQLAPNVTMRAGVQGRWGKDSKSQAAHLGVDWRF